MKIYEQDWSEGVKTRITLLPMRQFAKIQILEGKLKASQERGFNTSILEFFFRVLSKAIESDTSRFQRTG